MVDVVADKVTVELEAEYNRFVNGVQTAEKQFTQSLDKMLSAGRITEKQLERHFDGILSPAKNQNFGAKGEAAGAAFGTRFGLGFVKTVVTSILGGAFLSAIIADARAMGDLEDAARRASIPLEKMQQIIFTLRREGLGESEAVKDIEKITRLVADAANNPRNSLARLFAENDVRLAGKSVEQVITDLSRLMQNAPEGAKRAITELLGISDKWIDVLEKGPEEFVRLQKEANAAGAVLDDVAFKKAKEFRDNWNEATTRWGDLARQTINELLPLLDTLITKALSFTSYLARAAKNDYNFLSILGNEVFGSGDLNALSNDQLKMVQQIASSLSGVGGVNSKETIQKVEEILAARNSYADFGDPTGSLPRVNISTGNNTTRLPGRYQAPKSGTGDPAEDAIRKRIALLEAEAETIGKTTFERDRARVAAELLAAAEKAGLQITPEVIEGANRLATQYALVADNTRLMKERFEAAQSVIKTFGNEAIDGIMGLIDGTKTLNQVLADTLRTFSKMALQAALLGEGPLATFFGTKSSVPGGAGGLFGALFGGLFGGGRAGGGPVTAGKAYVVGEKRPELFVPNVSGVIVPNTGRDAGSPTYQVFADMRDSSANAIAFLSNRIDRLERDLPDLITGVSAQNRRLAPG